MPTSQLSTALLICWVMVLMWKELEECRHGLSAVSDQILMCRVATWAAVWKKNVGLGNRLGTTPTLSPNSSESGTQPICKISEGPAAQEILC